jgi:hypothetical protein
MIKKVATSLFAALLAAPLLLAGSANAQSSAAASDKEQNTKAYVLLLSSNVDSKREAIVKTILQLSDADGAKFWPIYKEYEAERAKLDSAEAALIQEYAKAYPTISNDKAEELLTKSFKLDAERVELKKKYFGKVKSATSAVTASKFIEVENQLEDVAGLQAASVLPANPPSE